MNIKKLLLITATIVATNIGSIFASPVLCVINGVTEECLEWQDLMKELRPYQDKSCDLSALLYVMPPATHGTERYSQLIEEVRNCEKEMAIIHQRIQFIEVKKEIIVTRIRKQLNAPFVLVYNLDLSRSEKPYQIYFDPACDITQQVITQLNEEYLSSKQQQIIN